MSEIPERIEREMFEIRGRMAPDVRDLRQHTKPQVVGKQVSTKLKDRIKGALTGLGRSIANSAKRQVKMAQEAGRKRNAAPFTDAVKSDPRPLVLLVFALTAVLMTVRKISNGRN